MAIDAPTADRRPPVHSISVEYGVGHSGFPE